MLANLLDFDLEGLAAYCDRLGEKRFRATQLFRWIHQKGTADFALMSDLAKSLRDKLAGEAACGQLAGEVQDRTRVDLRLRRVPIAVLQPAPHA